jgi:hypothetical protein
LVVQQKDTGDSKELAREEHSSYCCYGW